MKPVYTSSLTKATWISKCKYHTARNVKSIGYKILALTLGCVLLATYAWVGAAGEKCAVKTGPSKELLKYMERTESILSKAQDLASKTQCGKSDGSNSAIGSARQAGSSFIGSVNGALDYSNFVSSTEFYIRSIVRLGEVPSSTMRDHDRLASMLDTIKRASFSIYDRCGDGEVFPDNVSEDASYDTKGKTVATVLDDLTSNHVKMINFYRETVVGFSLLPEEPTFILVGDNDAFKQALKKSYGSQAYGDCVVEEGAWDRIVKSLERLWSLGGSIEEGMNEWEEAWKLRNVSPSERMTIRLRFDSSSGDMGLDWGMATKRSDAVMLGLESSGPTNKHEGISGLVSDIGERTWKAVTGVGRMYDDFKAKLNTPQTTDEYLRQYQEMRAVKNDIFDEIKADYTRSKTLMAPEVQSSDLNVASLLSTHMALQKANAELSQKIKIAEQTCNQQGQGLGTCSYKN